MAKLASVVYGRALFMQGRTYHTTDTLYEEALAVKEALEAQPELIRLLEHPDVTVEEKLRLTERIFRRRVSDDMTGFLLVIVRKGRAHFMLPILEDFIGRVKEYRGIGIVRVTSASPLTEEQKAEVQARVEETTSFSALEMHWDTDPSLLGGVVIRIGDRVADGSVSGRLRRLREKLEKVEIPAYNWQKGL